MSQPIVGLVSVTDPRPTALAREREEYYETQHNALKAHLEAQGMKVLDPGAELREGWTDIFGMRSIGEIQHCVKRLQAEGAEALIVGVWHWTEPGLTTPLVIDTGVPACLFIERSTGWAGSCAQASSGASLLEQGYSDVALRHERIRGSYDEVTAWAKGACAHSRLRKQAVLLWGASYSLAMEHLRDDPAALKCKVIGDVLEEGQYYLIKRAEQMVAGNDPKIDEFITWLQDNGAQITFDDPGADRVMLTPDSIRRQIALYLAARQRLGELGDWDIVGVSVKCQNELSEDWGCTGCFLPGFLPFPVDAQGPQRVISTTCEGDLKTLLTCCMFHAIEPDVPALFGDFKHAGDEYFLISNCGAASVYYAANSNDPAKALPGVRIEGQCHCASGGAVGWDGLPGPYTVGRLIRIKGEYYMQLGLAEAQEVTDEVKANAIFGPMWPHHALSMPTDPDRLIKVLGGNHFAGMPGDVTAEMSFACRQAGIPVVRLDNPAEVDAFYQKIALM
ncbi:MAG TPA: fucose isomerase [Armatimonadota bacterium]|nr:fucose isomerase [Armatimonadota bacterium]